MSLPKHESVAFIDPPAIAMALFVVAHRALAVLAARNDGDGVLVSQVPAQPVGIIATVGDQAADRPGRLGQHRLGRPDIAAVAGREVDDRGPANHVGEHVDLRGQAAARPTDRLRLAPPLPPCAQRCALT